LNPGRRGGKPVANRLSYGAAHCHMLLRFIFKAGTTLLRIETNIPTTGFKTSLFIDLFFSHTNILPKMLNMLQGDRL
jgi:hypothetical protein